MVITGNIIRREESTIPNHVRNVLKFSKLSAKDKEFILDHFATEMNPEGDKDIYPLNRYFDFDKIIAEPRKKEECDPDCLVSEHSHVIEDKERPWFDWYAWHNKYWGTKWNCYDGYVKVGTSTITFVFSTAWSAPFPIYEQLARFFCFKFEVRYADEDYGSNCGKLIYDPEKTGFEDIVHITERDLLNADQFARNLWREY